MITARYLPLVLLYLCGAVNAATPLSAETELKKGTTAYAKESYETAITHCKQGIAILGNKYVEPNTIDDSGMKLEVAKIEEEKQNHKMAAGIYCRVLESRILGFKSKRLSEKHDKQP
jgi:hypothetical protein